MRVEVIFKSIAEKLAIDFQHLSSEIEHRGAKGRVREVELVEVFLSEYLPGNVEVAQSGEIVSTSGETSSECDVLVFDPRGPKLIEKTGYRVLPVECVYGVIEVKSKLDTRELRDAHSKILKAKRLPKVAFMPPSGSLVYSTNIYGSEWTYFPLVGFVFAYDSIELVEIRKELDILHGDSPFHLRVDSVWVLGKGMVVNWSNQENKIVPAPGPGTRLRALSSDNPLLLMTVQLQQLFQGAWMADFRLLDYLSHAAWGKFLET